MRHGKKFNHLSRKKGHRKALLSNMASQLIEYKRIRTTLAKAKALRVFVEPIITKGKNDTTHSRRIVFKKLQNKEAVKELFSTVAEAVAERPGGYTRIIRTGFRPGDNAEMAFIELVDFNTVYNSKEKKKTRRGGNKKNKTEDKAVGPIAGIDSDDLTKIEGIGPKVSEALTNNGIATFAQLADAEPDAIKTILTEANSRFKMMNPKSWPVQAALIRDGKTEELEKLQDHLDGGVYPEDKA